MSSSSSSRAAPSRKRRLADDAVGASAGAGSSSSSSSAGDWVRSARPKLDAQDQQLSPDAILRLVEQAADVPELDARRLKQLHASLEKAVATNAKMRIKFLNQPERFIDSEAALDDAITALMPVATVPQLLVELGALGTTQTLLQLLGHENPDIGIDVVQFFFEVTNVDEQESAEPLVRDFVKQGGPRAVLDFVLNSLKEVPPGQGQPGEGDDDAEAVFKAIGIVENVMEIQPELVEAFLQGGASAQSQSWLEYLIRRANLVWPSAAAAFATEPPNQNRLYASEVLSIVMHHSGAEGQRLFRELKGFETCLKNTVQQAVAHPPQHSSAIELVENTINSLCLALDSPVKLEATDNSENQEYFGAMGGVQAMLALAKQRRHATSNALKTLQCALVRCPANCERFVDAGGLKTLFAFFSGKKSYTLKRKFAQGVEHEVREEYVLAMIMALFLSLADVRYLRLRQKFLENDMVKVERLVKLYVKFSERVLAVDEASVAGMDEDEAELELFSMRLDAGLVAFQSCALILGLLITAGLPELRAHAALLLKQHRVSLSELREQLKAYREQLNASPAQGDPDIKERKVLEYVVVHLLDEE